MVNYAFQCKCGVELVRGSRVLTGSSSTVESGGFKGFECLACLRWYDHMGRYRGVIKLDNEGFRINND